MKATDLILVISILYSTETVLCDVTKPLCDDGWRIYNNSCYLINNVKSVSKASAEAECIYYDSHLLDVQSPGELNYVVAAMKMRPSGGYWTALNDISNNVLQKYGTGIWEWGQYEIASMSLISWSKSPTMDGVSNCAGVNIQGKMVDLDCNSKEMFICKAFDGTQTGCPLGWYITEFNCYYVSGPSQLKTWEQAKSYCENAYPNMATELFVIAKQKDVSFLMSELPYLPITTHIFWTGLRLDTRYGSWGWYTQDLMDLSLLQWQAEPDNIAGAEHCGVLRTTGHFSDRNCSSNANFICEKPQYYYNVNNDVGCGPWIRAGRYCYGFITEKRHAGTWAEARTYCQSMGADLIKVDSYDKKMWLELQMMAPSNDKLFWTGLNDIQSESTYVWADGTPLNHSCIKWNQEPNNFKGQENCALIYSTGQFNDVPCITHAAAICEMDSDGNKGCPDGWLGNGLICYLFTPFNNESVLYNQPEASSYCLMFGGRLLSICDENAKGFINQVLKNKLPENIYGWWTSLNDKQLEGFWSFGRNPPHPTFIEWQGEPSNNAGDDCGLVTYAGHYFQRNCNSKINFICEKKAKGSSIATDPRDTNKSDSSGSNSRN